MNRVLFVCIACAIEGLTAAGDVLAQTQSDCAEVVPGRVAREIECRLRPSGMPEHLRFNARFSGSHDDTRASMEATLDAKPVTCDARSKTTTEGEDGDVTLHCVFALAKQADAQILRVKLRWHHAEYDGFDLLAE